MNPLPTFPRQSTVSPTDYRHLVEATLTATVQHRSEKLPLVETSGKVLAQDLRALRSVPHFANSQMDGYALTALGAAREDRTFIVGADVPAGSDAQDLPIRDDIAYPIMTGAPLPAGYDAVVPVERSRILTGEPDAAGFAQRGGQIDLPRADFGDFVRRVGEDIKAGELLAAVGSPITPALIGALASQGIGSIRVRSSPKVVLITGGDEITLDTEAALETGKILDANGPMLCALAGADGAETQRVAIGDSVEQLVGVLNRLVLTWRPDFMITSGGISHGKYEVVRLALTAMMGTKDARVQAERTWFGHVSQQPGGPQGLSLLRATSQEQDGGAHLVPVISLPGNPVSTLVSYVELVRPALAHLTGRVAPQPRHGVLALAEGQALEAPDGKTQYRRARLERVFESDGTVRTLLTPDPLTGSHLLHRAATAQVLVQLDPGITYRSGDAAFYLPL